MNKLNAKKHVAEINNSQDNNVPFYDMNSSLMANSSTHDEVLLQFQVTSKTGI